MDGRCWLWPSAGSNGTEVKAAHEAPVSKVVSLIPPESAAAAPAGKVNIRSHRTQARATASPGSRVLAASCSYDKSVKMWDFTGNRPQQLAVMTGHAGPVLEMAVQPVGAKVLTGDRKGNLMSWDLETCSNSWGAVAAHQGHITALAWMHPQQQQLHEALAAPGDSSGSNGSMAVSGGQDGCVRLWDTRASGCAAQQRLHANQQGKGAVGNICIGAGYSASLILSSGADMTLQISDPAMSLKPLHTVKLTEFPYCLTTIGHLAMCGCGDGSVHVVDVHSGRTLYALGAGHAAIRAVEVSADTLVCTGDDGNVLIYHFA
eukprot:GHRR01034504.1.p1 GENE.GHRR01034504.1~~GHRR01034504.1.p1  ORF type:complete len:318 (+),score=95.24 GHRR01034504.1:1664-2617(+)